MPIYETELVNLNFKRNKMVVPVLIIKSLPILKRMWIPLLNLVGEKNEFRIIVTSPDYVEFRLLWGVISYEKGEKKNLL